MNPNFEITLELDTSSEENLKKSLSKAISDNLNGNIRDEQFAKILSVASQTINTIQSYRDNATKLFWRIRHHLFEIRKYVNLAYEDGYDSITLNLSPEDRDFLDELKVNSGLLDKEFTKYLEKNGSWTREKPVYGILHEIVAVTSFIKKEYLNSKGTSRELNYMVNLAEDAIHSLLIAKEHLNNIKTNIIADNYYCNTINAEPFQSGFNPINYRFNNPNYQQPAMDVPSFGGPVFPSAPSNTGFNPNVTKHYYQNVYSEDFQETKIEQPAVISQNAHKPVSTQPTCDNPPLGSEHKTDVPKQQ